MAQLMLFRGNMGMATELTILNRQVVLERRLGRGATGEVWLARAAGGERYVVKLARERAAYAVLAEEAQRLFGVDSQYCVRLLGAGQLGAELSLDERTR